MCPRNSAAPSMITLSRGSARKWHDEPKSGTMDYEAVEALPEDAALARECRIWNEGYRFWWLLSNICRVPEPIPCRGNVGMWQLPDSLAAKVSAAVERL